MIYIYIWQIQAHTMDHQIFEKIPSLQIIVCRHCQHGVHPKEIITHLQTKHSMKPRESQPIAQRIAQWQDIIQHPEAVQIPRELDHPIPIIPVYTNGLQCQRDPNQCTTVTTSIKAMRNHWQEEHGWSQTHQRGVVPVARRAQQEAELQQSFRLVAWQKIFPTRKNSHLVHIRSRDPPPAEPPIPSTDREAMVAEIKAQAAADDQAAANQVIQAGQLQDANPWLRRTR